MRRASARGVTVPDDMIVQNQEYVDSETKVPGRRFNLRFDYWEVDSADRRVKNSAYVVLAIPESGSSTALTSLLATLRAAVAASGILEAVTNSEL